MPRTVSVAITANTSGFTAGMGKVSSSAKSAASSVSAAFGKGLDGIGKNKRNIDTLSNGLGKIGIVAGLGVGVAVKSFADFDKAMSGVAATGSDARANLEGLRAAAIKAGADTKYSATEAAGGIEALAKAGVSANDTLGGGLAGSLNLAAAGNLDVAGSAEAAASAMNQFGLAGADIPHIADLLAQSAGTAQGEVSDMAAALNQSGLIANQFGLSIDETAQALALFAKNGLVGSDAGTSFKTMLTSLYAPAGTASTALNKLGVSAYDASGAIKPIGVVTDELKVKLDQLSEGDRNSALKNIFGSDAIRAGTILLKDGSAGLAQMAGEFGKFGSAADVARTKMDNLSGDLEQLKGSFETALIGLGSGADGPLRSVVQTLTGVVNAFNDLGSGTKSAVLGVVGSLAGIAVSAAGIGKIAIFASEAKAALKGLGISARVAGIATAGIGAALGVAAIAFAAYSTHAAESKARVDDFTTALQSQTGAIQENVRGTAAKQLADSGALAAASNLGVNLATVTDAALGNAEAMRQVEVATDAAFQAGLNSNDPAVLQRVDDARTLSDAVRGTGTEYQKAVSQAKQFAEATAAPGAKPDAAAYEAAASALGALGDDASGAATSLHDLAAALFEANNAALASSNAQIGYEAAVDAAAAAASKLKKANKDGADALNVNTEAGRANRTLLNNQAAASQGYIQSLVEQGKGAKQVASATKGARSAFIANATAMGISGARARELANKYGLIPKKVKTQVETATGKSQADLGKVKAAIKGLPKKTRAEVIAAFNKGGISAAKKALDDAAKRRQARIDAKTSGVPGAKNSLDAAAKTRRAQLRAQTNGVPNAKNQLDAAAKTRRAQINVSANTGAANAAINNAARNRSSTITVHVNRTGGRGNSGGDPSKPGATGGLFTHGGVMYRGPLQRRSQGGPVWGAGTATSDSIPALLSDGEFVIRAAAVKAVGIAALREINAKGYNTGGPVGYAKGGSISNDAKVLRVIIAQHNLDEAKSIRERVAASKHLDAVTKHLADSLQQAADAARTTASSLAEPYKSKSHDIDDWLESMREGATDLGKFKDQVSQLRKLGLSQTLIQSITDQGALVGSELAEQILAGGQGLADTLNQANAGLIKAADQAGIDIVGRSPALPKKKKKKKGHAEGGQVFGPGTGTSDSIPSLLSNGEYVVNARSTAAYLSTLDAINYGRNVVDRRFMPAYATGGLVQHSQPVREIRGGDVYIQGNTIVDPDKLLRVAKHRQRDAMVMAGLSRSL